MSDTTPAPRPPNRLIGETSPYLRQHAHNPVDWYPWGEEALATARAEDKPIFLSIGYAACHWCHVMERESFEDEQVAAFLRRHFVAIKVDREERPDLDAVYMNAVQALSGRGGWPMSVFLTPAGRPFFGGTYFPPERRHGMPSFLEVLQAVADAWTQRRDELERGAAELTAQIASWAGTAEPGTVDAAAAAEAAVARLARRLRPPPRRLRRRAEVPHPVAAVLPAAARARRRRDAGGDAARHARRHGRRRHVRLGRRRLPPLLRRRRSG